MRITLTSSRARRIAVFGAIICYLIGGFSTFVPLEPAAAQSANTVCFHVDSNWGTGFQSTVTITNKGTSAIQNWQVEFDLSQNITSIWDSQIKSHVGSHYVIGAASWNLNIAPGAAQNFGFVGSLSGTLSVPSSFILNGVTVSCTGTPPPPPDTQAPTAPGNLRVTATTSSSASLAWNAATDNVGVTAYDVFRGTTNVGSTAGTTFTVTGLAAATTFSFTVKARDAAGNVSAASNSVNATTQPAPVDAQPPAAPGNLRVTATSSSSVSLAWNASTDNVGVTAYDVFRGTATAGSTGGTSFTVTGLAASTTFSFTVKARDAAGNVSAASNSVSATTSAPGGGIPGKIIVGYWHNFDNGSGFIKLRDVSPDFDVINVAFATPMAGSTSNIEFVPDPGHTSVAEVKSDIATMHSRGKKVVISIGGANGVVQLNTSTDRQNFIDSTTSIISQYGFDGMDIDFEGTSISLNGGDTDFRSPTTPKIVNLISAIRTVANTFGGSFVLSMAPETFFVQVGFEAYGGSAGAFLPVIEGVRDKLTYIHVQHYNTGSVRALDGVAYNSANADFHVAMAEMLLHGFPVAGDATKVFQPLREDQVAIGLPASPSAAGSGFTPPAEVQRALNYLIKGIPFGGQYVLRKPSGYPGFRGLMTWSINWDAVNGFEFSRSHRAFLDSL